MQITPTLGAAVGALFDGGPIAGAVADLSQSFEDDLVRVEPVAGVLAADEDVVACGVNAIDG